MASWVAKCNVLFVVCFMVAAGACGPVDEFASELDNTGKMEFDLGDFEFSHGEKIDISLAPHQPGAGGEEDLFPFCHVAESLKLNNAAWLAYMSLIQYNHFGYIGEALDQLGFGDKGEGTRLTRCAYDLYALRASEKKHMKWINQAKTDKELELATAAAREEILEDMEKGDAKGPHVCVLDWYKEAEGEFNLSGAAFEKNMIQKIRPGSKIQFFSGGKFNSEDYADEFKAGSTQVMWVQHRTLPYVIISFRGTELRSKQKVDAWNDLKFRQRDFIPGWGEVHRGFLDALEEVDELLLAKLEELAKVAEEEQQEYQIWITGHSLGGALANLLAARFLAEDKLPQIKGMYSFGSPRVGNKDFVKKFEETASKQVSQIWGFRHEDDVVTQIPFSFLSWDYFHAGNRAWIKTVDGNNVFQIPESAKTTDWRSYDRDDTPKEIIEDLWENSAKDHSMDFYYEAMKQYLHGEYWTGAQSAQCDLYIP